MECEIEEIIVEFPPVINIPVRSSLYLGKRRNLMLNIHGGMVHRMRPYSYMKLTSDRWVKFIDYLATINEVLKSIVLMTRWVSFCAHIANGYYVTEQPLALCEYRLSQYAFVL